MMGTMETMGTMGVSPLVCADCGAVYGSGVSLLWSAGAWYCADEAGCAERTARRYHGDALIWPDDEAAHVAETVDELRKTGRE